MCLHHGAFSMCRERFACVPNWLFLVCATPRLFWHVPGIIWHVSPAGSFSMCRERFAWIPTEETTFGVTKVEHQQLSGKVSMFVIEIIWNFSNFFFFFSANGTIWIWTTEVTTQWLGFWKDIDHWSDHPVVGILERYGPLMWPPSGWDFGYTKRCSGGWWQLATNFTCLFLRPSQSGSCHMRYLRWMDVWVA